MLEAKPARLVPNLEQLHETLKIKDLGVKRYLTPAALKAVQPGKEKELAHFCYLRGTGIATG
jgi:hypothetical protein